MVCFQETTSDKYVMVFVHFSNYILMKQDKKESQFQKVDVNMFVNN